MNEQGALAFAVTGQLRAAKEASRVLAKASTRAKNEALYRMADALWSARDAILSANAEDVAGAAAAGQTPSRMDRLRLTEDRLRQAMEGLQEVAELPDPVGEVIDSSERPNGISIQQIRVPMGVIAMIYESRPNVTVDGAGLCIKTGNAVVLRGSSESLGSNAALVAALRQGLADSGLPEDGVQLVDRPEHAAVDVLLRARGLVDLAVPRGGAGLIARVVQEATVPVIETGVGNCHVYVDADADLAMATAIIVNAKTERPSVCNAAETLLVHEAVAAIWLPEVVDELRRHGVEVRACERTRDILDACGAQAGVIPASESDWSTEFLDLILAVRVVASLDEALAHIASYGTQHSEVIVTGDAAAAERFLQEVDAAAVYHNASSRFTDGFEFGFGAEIGISTQKLHARGPMGLRELTSYKYVLRGNGQVRN